MFIDPPWNDELSLSRDEKRMVRLFRCLDLTGREDVLIRLSQEAIESNLEEGALSKRDPGCLGIISFVTEGNKEVDADAKEEEYYEQYDSPSPERIVRESLEVVAKDGLEWIILGTSDADEELGRNLLREIEVRAAYRNVWLSGQWTADDCIGYFDEWRWSLVLGCEGATRRRREQAVNTGESEVTPDV